MAKRTTINLVRKARLILLISGIIGLLILPLLNLPFVKASSLSDLQKRQQELSKQINQNSKLIQQKQKEAEELKKVLSKINSEIDQIQAKINETEEKLNQTQKSIEDTTNQIVQKEKELAEQKEYQAEALRLIYENSQAPAWEIILSSGSISEIVGRSDYLEALEQKIGSTIEEIQKLKTELEAKKTDLGRQKAELDDLKSQQEAYSEALGIQKGQKQKVLGDNKSQQKDLQAQVEEAKKLSAQVEAEISRIMASISAGRRGVVARDRGTSAVGLQWPMDYLYISAYWGESTPFQAAHTGIDLVNVLGSPIYSASSGTVTAVESMQMNGRYYGYGNYVVIGHNARYSSLYAHLMNFNVQVGQEVKQGQVIGYMGSTGWSTGPHLHFEVWEYGTRYNPLNYLP